MILQSATSAPLGRHQTAGYTLVEVVVSALIGVIVAGFLGVTMLTTAREQRQALVQASLETDANLVVDKLSAVLRSMSVTASVIFADPVSSSPGCYHQVIVAQGEPGLFPREAIIYDPVNYALTHDPDRNIAGNERLLCRPSGTTVLRNFFFYPSFMADGSSDSTTLNVFLLVDDDGSAGRKNPDGTPKRMSVSRSFTIKMRNN